MKLKWLIFALVLVSLLIIPATAQTLTGSLGGSQITSVPFTLNNDATLSLDFSKLFVKDIQNSEGMSALIRFDNGQHPTFSNSLGGNATRFTIISGGQTVANGSFGYARFYGFLGADLDGYQYYAFDFWNVTGLSGDTYLTVDMPNIDSISISTASTNVLASGKISIGSITGFGTDSAAGNYLNNIKLTTLNSYSATKPSGIGIEGYVFKHADGDATLYPSQAFIFNGTDGTPITNDVGITPSFLYFNVPAQSIKIGVKDALGNWYNSSVLFTSTLPTTSPTPTITPLPNASPYALTLVPQAIPIGGNVSAELHSSTDPSFAQITGIQYYYADDNSASNEFFDTGSVTLVKEYTLIGGTWKQYDHTTNDYTNTVAGLPNPVNLQFKGLAGTKEVSAWITVATGQSYRLTGMVYVGQGQNYVNTRVQAVNGLDGGIVYNPEIDILNQNTGAWVNSTYANGQASISTSANTQLSFYGKLAGYSDAQLLNKPSRSDVIYGLQFFPGTNPSAGNQTFTILVTEDNLNLNNAIPGALIKLTGNGGTLTGTSSADGGSYQSSLKQATTYSYSISKTGYKTSSGSFTTTLANSDYRVFTLQKGSNVVTPTPSGVITVPTTLPNGQAGNYTGFWSPFYKGFAGMGATAAELGLIMTMCAILFGLIVMAVVTHGEPRAISIGGSFGLIFASMIGWVSIWLIAAGVAWAMMSIFTFRNNSG